MSINSRMWGVGWRKPKRLPPLRRKAAKKAAPPDWQEEMDATGWPSIPGRTARLKAIYLLQIAAEVEHALMAQYLYSAYSLDEAFDQPAGGQTTSVVDRWKRDIRLIARQEMAHFVTVQNLLISLGAEVYVNRENNFSEHPDTYPFPVRFERFDLSSLARYVATERPARDEIKDQETQSLLNKILKLVDKESTMKVNRVGILYASLYWLFLRNDESSGPWQVPSAIRQCMKLSGLGGVHVKDSDFVQQHEYHEFAATPDEWEVFEDSMHVDHADPRSRALRAIHWIMLQGEGPSGSACDKDESHFCKFLRVYGDLTGNPALAGAARRVPLNPIVLGSHRTEPVRAEAEPITHPETRLWAQLFNTRYQMLLLDVLLALSTSRDHDPDLRSELTTWAGRNEMEHLKKIGQLLPSLPRHRGSKRLRGGAPFETVQFPADNTKRWDQQRVLMQGSEQLVRKLQTKVSPHDERFSILRAIEIFDRDRKRSVEERSTASRNYVWKEGNRRIQS
jgi:Ferritin-like